jgi:hypothetical protein
MLRRTCLGLMLSLSIVSPTVALAQSGQYRQLHRTVIEDRLRQYAGRDSVREATLKRLFEEAGCTGKHLEEQPIGNTDAPNVVCTLPGAGDKVIIVGAHFDHAYAGEGVVDNWSGASLLPSLYQSLSSMPRQHTYIFVSFSDEEEGFIGSSHYPAQLTNEQVERIQCMIDIDTLGLGPTKVWASNSDPRLVKQVSAVAEEMKLPVSIMNVDQFGNSDGQSFQRRRIPIITLHSVTTETLGILHTNKDNLSAMKLDDYYDSYTLIAAYLASLDSAPSPEKD